MSGISRLLVVVLAVIVLGTITPGPAGAAAFPAEADFSRAMARSAGLFSNPEAHRCWSAVFAVVTYANSRYGNGISFVDPFYRDWRFICPGQGRDEGGGLHWGVTCPYPSCPEGPGKYVSINIARIGSSNDRLYYVVAHELAHSWGRYHGYRDWNDEDWADRTAGLLGANVCSNSPYC